MKNFSCDIFCRVVDNYGDIGVCWRLARQLADEFEISVRLWVDDLDSFARLCPDADARLDIQCCRKVEVRRWGEAFSEIAPADLVIETFSCKLPEFYLARMDASQVWINLEYLCAEDWVEGCHKLPSPRPPLTRYFFFPGFTKKTGGLLLERDLFARRDAFLKQGVGAFWRSLNMDVPPEDTLKISLFSYENAALCDLFNAFSSGSKKILCLVPEGRILPQVASYFGAGAGPYDRGNLRVAVLPFVAQEKYDELLWACDINFVRGEDSFVRAQWSCKPFVWQIYPQHDAVHWHKLDAFLDLYGRRLSVRAGKAVKCFWEAWNKEEAVQAAWEEFVDARFELADCGRDWAAELSKNNLALNLLDFFQELGTMRAFKIEGQ